MSRLVYRRTENLYRIIFQTIFRAVKTMADVHLKQLVKIRLERLFAHAKTGFHWMKMSVRPLEDQKRLVRPNVGFGTNQKRNAPSIQQRDMG